MQIHGPLVYWDTLDTFILASKKSQTFWFTSWISYFDFRYLGFSSLQHIQKFYEISYFKNVLPQAAKMANINADEYFTCVGYVC